MRKKYGLHGSSLSSIRQVRRFIIDQKEYKINIYINQEQQQLRLLAYPIYTLHISQLTIWFYFRVPGYINFEDPVSEGIPGSRNFYLDSEPGVKLGVWQILPADLEVNYFHYFGSGSNRILINIRIWMSIFKFVVSRSGMRIRHFFNGSG